MKEYLIYARENCPFCKNILTFMKERDMKFVYATYYNLDSNLKRVMEQFGWRTVPIVLEIDPTNGEQKLIGGCDDAIEYFKKTERKNDE